MQTPNTHPTNHRSARTIVIAALGAVALAATLTAGFVLGGRSTGTSPEPAEAQLIASPTAAASASTGDNATPNSTDPTDAASPTVTTPADVSATPTATPDDDDNCNFCDDDPDFAIPSPTPKPCKFCLDNPQLAVPSPTPNPDPCPLCNDGLDFAPIDIDEEPPVIFNVHATICGATFTIDFDVDGSATAWVHYQSPADDYESAHVAASPHAHIEMDIDWDTLVADFFYIDAFDIVGNVTQNDGPHPIPTYGAGC
jgi:hypothetical protein